jgi:hypothetical protein
LIFMRPHHRLQFVNMASDIRGNQMEADDQDSPTAYLLFAIAAIIVIGVTAAAALVLLIRNWRIFGAISRASLAAPGVL